MKEEAHHAAAFERYHAMGPGRSLGKLARQVSVSVNTAKRWSAEFDWKSRLVRRDHAVKETMAERAVTSEVSARLQTKQLVEVALIQIARQLAEGKIRASLTDLDRIVRLRQFLDGEPDSRAEVVARDLRGKSMDELRQIARDEIDQLAELAQDLAEN